MAPLTLELSAAKSTDADGSIVGWFWELGNGQTATTPTVTTTFNEPGGVKVILTVTDNEGATDRTGMNFLVGEETPLPGEILIPADSPAVTRTGYAKLNTVNEKGSPLTGRANVEVAKWSTNTNPASRVEFTPDIPTAGLYDVYVRWPGPNTSFSVGLSRSVPIEVVYAEGSRSHNLTQRIGNVWVYLGAFPFEAGTGGKVVIDAENTVGGISLTDVRFVPVSPSALVTKPRVLPIPRGNPDRFDKMRAHLAVVHTPHWDANISDPAIARKVAEEQALAYFYWKSMWKHEGINDLWPDQNTLHPIEDNVGGGSNLRRTYERLYAMSAAYVGSNGLLGFADKMQGNPELLADILWGLNWLYENRYNEHTTNRFGGVWIAMQFEIPLYGALSLNLIHPEVPVALREKMILAMDTQMIDPTFFYGKFISSGFNRIYGVYCWAIKSIAKGSAEDLDRVFPSIEQELKMNNRSDPEASRRDGFYADGSFIQHNTLPYMSIYGGGLVEKFSWLKTALAGSDWAITDPRADIFNEYVYKGYVPLMFGGDIMYGTWGRSTGMSWPQNGASATDVMKVILPLIQAANPADKIKLSAYVKRWMTDRNNAAFPEFIELADHRMPLAGYQLIGEIMADESIPVAPKPSGFKMFYNTDLAVYHRPDYAVMSRMFSTRIMTHEDINEGTNRLGWYQGEGTLFLYDRDNSRYNDNYWATVDPYRLPGITVDPRPREVPGAKDGQLSESPWAGGVSLDGFGLQSMGLNAVEATLSAKKAWFYFGDQIVCLGSDIQSTDNRPIETIVENTKLHGAAKNALTIDGAVQPSNLGWEDRFTNVSHAHLEGNVEGGDVGWYFPGGSDINAKREARTGKWTDNYKSDKNTAAYTRNYLTLWYDHGSNPSNAQYAYVMLPGLSAAETADYASDPGVTIVENSADAQTVKSAALGVMGANFWKDQAYTSGVISSTGKAAVLATVKSGRIAIAVADPTQLGDTVDITLNLSGLAATKLDPGVTVISLNPLKIKVDLKNSNGKTFKAEFSTHE